MPSRISQMPFTTQPTKIPLFASSSLVLTSFASSLSSQVEATKQLRTNVTKNLHSALLHLRDPERERMLWVDALCINQDDPKERGEQVAKMVSNLLKRPWFQRMWMLQEAVLGRHPVLLCGFETLPWESLSKCYSNGDLQGTDDGPEMHQAMQAIDTIKHGRAEHHTTYVKIPGRRRGSRKKYTPDFKLVSTLYEARGFKCKDVRDKVFGVLSLATNVGGEDKMLRPNY
ncbi:hypothetical protein DER46DRAFT_577590 [Fusarium sp. MPI-SDFR-AT-0072]|nr:hypothetical protein DER46DRAFT_577590 [Fusarium sp. MPI-SDFR-AT-0072]